MIHRARLALVLGLVALSGAAAALPPEPGPRLTRRVAAALGAGQRAELLAGRDPSEIGFAGGPPSNHSLHRARPLRRASDTLVGRAGELRIRWAETATREQS